MKDKADVSIIGCGWLGLPLAERLVQSGKIVKGSTTTPEKLELLEQKGIYPYLINLQEEQVEEVLSEFLHTDILVINIPPRLKSGMSHLYIDQLQSLRKAMLASAVSKVLFVSSTSVYLDLNRSVTEADTVFTEEQNPQNAMLQAEKLFLKRDEWMTTIVRFGGLVGGSRQAGRFLAGKKQVPNGDAPVNLIHQEDCLSILEQIMQQQKWGRVYNACADGHPTRKDFYTRATLAMGGILPEFDEMQETRFKLISSQELKHDLAYTFLYPDPMMFFS
ncbi:NAD(P)-binding domain-containing protein [Pontibacter sp. SGAir0037]|uniref:NAD(P)-binding domain-containing protein n=1 Tax=Pontibacter sp. SGAir0037 TaxID=2571030 RepID=UPI0010CD2544|nr:NAD(P)H-binding protein [Pontibacter sp. SGAir0037]QCR21779.1 NAD(P)-dependent oxidoreductase [Pontibacter sp. SGAir0037]